MHIKCRQSNSGHCLSFGPLDLIYLLVAGLISLIVPVATALKIIITVMRRGTNLLDGPDLPVDERLPVIRGPLVSAAELDIVAVTSNDERAHCPICATALASEDIVTCPRCKTKHHQDCWKFNDSCCAVYGCAMTTEVPQTAVELKKPLVMPPLAKEQFDKIRRRFRRWFWSYRLQWWSTVSFCFIAASGFLVATLGVVSRGITSSFTSAALYAFTAALLFFILARVTRLILEGSCEKLPAVPPERMTGLLQKIEKSKSRPLIERAIEWSPYVFTMMAILPLSRLAFIGGSRIATWGLFSAICFLFGGFFVWMALISTRRHRATLERIRCRLRGVSKV